jgi:hypothetical protein
MPYDHTHSSGDYRCGQHYTSREVLQARAAHELMVSLAQTSSSAMIDMLDSRILNCSVNKTDVRNADAIFGQSIPSLKGKTVHQQSAPTSSHCVLHKSNKS